MQPGLPGSSVTPSSGRSQRSPSELAAGAVDRPSAAAQVDAGWVTRHTGARLDAAPGVAVLALRRNPRRAHLLVSLLLGKHVPVPAAAVLGAASALGARVQAALAPSPAVVVGFAETATALGHQVAASVTGPDGAPLPYVHTTRRPLPAGLSVVRFQEEHSHAVDQQLALVPELVAADVVVLVDDELSSGRTAVNVIRVLQQHLPARSRRYVLASLLDVRDDSQRAWTSQSVESLGASLLDVCLHRGSVHLPADLSERAAALVEALWARPVTEPAGPVTGPVAPVTEVGSSARRPSQPSSVAWHEVRLPAGTPVSAATGWDAAAASGLRAATRELAGRLALPAAGVPGAGVLVLGEQECLYPGQLLAEALGPGARTSSTTRSPALVVDADGYPLRSSITVPPGLDDYPTYAYNILGEAADVVLVTDRTPDPALVAALADGARVHVVVLTAVG